MWSNLDYALQLGVRGTITDLAYSRTNLELQNYDPLYAVDHYNGKGRFAAFLESQKNPVNDENGTMWTVYTNGPYMDM